ncbi:MAG: transketolase [Cyanobacteria bacterium NC_groundwater_1444_Ag_S-0.65um_54_12]|nr:transketolase [Cyanobacteria bacterium NC_groundwater_1444_Ag_S-0.65um_54_12]
MGIIDTKTGKESKLDQQQLIEAARELRAVNLISIYAARSGHPGGTLSIMDIAAALFLNEARLDPVNPDWPERDRIFFSTGHKAPALYVALAKAGFYTYEQVVTLRKLNSPFQGHPHAPYLPGVEVSSGSLGQGLGIAVGCALAGKLDAKNYRVYCIMGDGEQQEGSIWEAAMSAGQFKLANLCAIIDRNRLQIDGWVKDVMNVEPLADKYRAFNWQVIEIDGHDMGAILAAFAQARATKDQPTVIIADTIKGKGVSFMEDQASWHGVPPKDDAQFARALADIACPALGPDRVKELFAAAKQYQQKIEQTLETEQPAFSRSYWWNAAADMKVEMEPTRFGFGRCLARIGNDPRIVPIHADISGSIKITDFEQAQPERLQRVISVGIAEQNMMQVAAGLALEGKIPVTGTYGVFASGRPWDQLRTTICYDKLNVKIAGAHGGISVGADGATHQALEEIPLMAILPNMTLFVPCDAVETDRICEIAFLEVKGPAYVRFAREATPIVTSKHTPLVFGKANVIRYRGSATRFVDAFETILASEYQSEKEDLSLLACGPMVPEAMRAACILKEEFDLAVRVLNFHTLKPIDRAAIIGAVKETGVVITCEEHQKGGFGGIVASVINLERDYKTPLLFDMIGVEDRFGESGGPWELMKKLGLTAEHIATKARRLAAKKPQLLST